MIAVTSHTGWADWLRRLLGQDHKREHELGPPVGDTADEAHVVEATRQVVKSAERSERMVRRFADRQQREIEALKERIAGLTSEIDVLRRDFSE